MAQPEHRLVIDVTYVIDRTGRSLCSVASTATLSFRLGCLEQPRASQRSREALYPSVPPLSPGGLSI